MPAAKANLYIEQGATWLREFQWVNRVSESEVVPYDITGCTITMHMRVGAQQQILVEASTVIGNITILDAAQGKFRIKLKPSVTSLLDKKAGKYDIEITYPNADQDTYRILEGDVEISQNITQLAGEPVLS